MKSLKEIELLYDFSQVTYENFSVWMLLRSFIHLKIVERDSNGYSMSFRTRNIRKLLKNGLRGISNLLYLRRFDYWFFTNTDKRNLVNGKYKENYFDDISDQLGQDKSLFVEYTIDAFKSKKSVYSKHCISDLIFKLFASLISQFVDLKNVTNLASIREVMKDENLNFDLNKVLKRFISEYKLYKLLFRYGKPKAIFVICYYSKIPLVLAAHDCKIKVIEYQHGVITDENDEYNCSLANNQRYFPDLLLTFGRNLLINNYIDFIYRRDKILPLGSSYMETIRVDFKDTYLEKLKEKYSNIVCVTSSGIFLNKLMEFVQYLSFKHPDYIFIIRKKHREEVDKYLSESIVILPQYNIYQILKYSDYNITIGSFVAYEADYYGVNNILLNINGLSRKYISSDINGIFVDEKDMMNFVLPKEKKIFTPCDNYFVRFNDRIKPVCQLLKSELYIPEIRN